MRATLPTTVPSDFLKVSDLDADQLAALLDLAAQMKERPHGFVEALRGDTVVCFFEKPSTRTRVSFAAAAERLGMLPLLLRPGELPLGRGAPAGPGPGAAGGSRSGTPPGPSPATPPRSSCARSSRRRSSRWPPQRPRR